jgi:hypothetical protein
VAAFPAGGGVTLTGITDSSLALLVAGSCVSPPPAMRAISFVAATLVAFEVRWTPSPAQILFLFKYYYCFAFLVAKCFMLFTKWWPQHMAK